MALMLKKDEYTKFRHNVTAFVRAVVQLYEQEKSDCHQVKKKLPPISNLCAQLLGI